MADVKVAKKRQTDPDWQLLRAVKKAAADWEAAKLVLGKAEIREQHTQRVLFELIDGAPEAQRAYLRSLAVRSEA